MLAPTRWRVRRPVAAVIAVVALVLALAVVVVDHWNKEKPMPVQGHVASAITTEDLTAVAHTSGFFGHQSVGMNMLNAIPGIYTDRGVSAPIPQGGKIHILYMLENKKPVAFDFATARDRVLTDYRNDAIGHLRLGDETFLRRRANVLIADDVR